MKLIIVHYHLRPGGVRRIIELATPFIQKSSAGKIKTVVLACGELPDPSWLDSFRCQLRETEVELFVKRSFGYFSELKAPVSVQKGEIVNGLKQLLTKDQESVVWFHNPGIGRNLLLTKELLKLASRRKVPVICHHHDWWFDNRWARWYEMQEAGFNGIRSVLDAIFPRNKSTCHVCINRADARLTKRVFPERTRWMPNLIDRTPNPPAERLLRARSWVSDCVDSESVPVWLLPCRMLRRKNVAEALLLTRWLRPEAFLLVTGAASSPQEQFYCDTLADSAKHHGWRFRAGILKGDEATKPAVSEIMAVSEAVLLTSILEGFGLPYLEAAAANRPLIARNLPNVTPDLNHFGFRLPQSYDDILTDPSLFDWETEVKRQSDLFERWLRQLPTSFRRTVESPALLGQTRPEPVSFSRLTLSAQLEVLRQPLDHSWEKCAPLNPFLKVWRRRANSAELKRTSWPASAEKWLSGKAYATAFHKSLHVAQSAGEILVADTRAAKDFTSSRLSASHLFPLLWAAET